MDEFVVRGTFDGRVTAARWVDGRLVAETQLWSRARRLVSDGELFAAADDPGCVVQAALDHGLTAALLTVIHAFTSVSSITAPTPR
jgi:hypothetical protein